MNFTKFIDHNLDKFLPSERREPKNLHKAMRYSVFSGGKRLRPIILIEAALACGEESLKKSVAAACAVEFIHTYSLIHDDLPSMDDDDSRRGKPSCHKAFTEGLAILAGDALLTLAFGVLAGSYPSETSAEMTEELSRAVGSEGMVGGQALDIEKYKNAGSRLGRNYSSSEVEKHNFVLARTINRLKTAKLFEASAVLGALSVGAGEKNRKAMRIYGAALGMAFQAVDDILDGEGRPSRRDAEILTAKAKAALKIFGRRAEKLKEIADSLILRAEGPKDLDVEILRPTASE